MIKHEKAIFTCTHCEKQFISDDWDFGSELILKHAKECSKSELVIRIKELEEALIRKDIIIKELQAYSKIPYKSVGNW